MSKFSPEALDDLDDHQARQRATIDQFNAAMEAEDSETAHAIADYVINADDVSNKMFSRGWQMHCLNWLTAHHFSRWRNSPDDSEEEDESLSGLLDCLWKFKWLVGVLPSDLHESREDLAEAVQHMADLYEEFNFSRRMVDKALMEQAILMGDTQAAQEHFAKWQAADKDDMNDCEACETNALVDYYHFIGDYQQAVKLAKPILLGELSCGEVPHLTYYPAIDSLIQLGEVEDATDYLTEAIQYIDDAGDNFMFIMPKLIQLAYKLNDKDWAESLLDDYNDTIIQVIQNSRYDYLQYLIAVAPFNEEALLAARGLAREFDERNGNRYYQNQLALMFTPPIVH